MKRVPLLILGGLLLAASAHAQDTPAAMVSPVPGTSFAGSSATFTWDAGVNVLEYWLSVGSTADDADYFDSGPIPDLSTTVETLPVNGSTVHVTLWSNFASSGWTPVGYQYTAIHYATLTAPDPAERLPGSIVQFTWDPVPGATGYRLEVGSSEGGSEYLDTGEVTSLTAEVTGLPIDGSTVYAKLSTSLPTFGWVSVDYALLTYTILPEQPDAFQIERIWPGDLFGIPPNLGGLLFSRDGSTLYVVGESELSTSALYALPVMRDPVTNRVTNLGPGASLVFVGAPLLPGLDAGWEFGPADTLFYTYWSANHIAQRPGGFGGTESVFDMATIGVPSSVAGLTFSPHLDDPQSGFTMMQISAWQGADIYNIPLQPQGGGLFAPTSTELFVTLPRQGTGAIQYTPSGPFEGNLMYVNWDFGEVMMVVIDPATGYPINDLTGLPELGTTTPRTVRFASGLGIGPSGLEFDPLTNDFFITTWVGFPNNSIIHFSGAGLPAPTDELRIVEIIASDGVLTVEWEGPAGLDHTLESSATGTIWDPILTVLAAPSVNRRNFAVPADPALFLRVSIP